MHFSVTLVAYGFIGILPFVIGLAIIITVFLYGNFRFKTVETSLFALFYCMNGDTYFDTGTAALLQNQIMAFFFYFLMLNYMLFGVNKVTLAIVEEGYLTSKDQTSLDWIAKRNVKDPNYQTKL